MDDENEKSNTDESAPTSGQTVERIHESPSPTASIAARDTPGGALVIRAHSLEKVSFRYDDEVMTRRKAMLRENRGPARDAGETSGSSN